jgi:hypothetical protein
MSSMQVSDLCIRHTTYRYVSMCRDQTWQTTAFSLHSERRSDALRRAEECDHIVAMSQRRLARSGVVVTKTGGSEVSEIRTSSGVFLNRGEDAVIKRIEERISAWTLLPVGNGEGMQVLKYDQKQKYDAHWDYL